MAMLTCIAPCLRAQQHGSVDSMKTAQLGEVVVKSVQASATAPFAVTNINGSQMQSFAKTGQELPFLFARTPGVMAWSENGLGTGTTYMRIRGAADSRINVTIDGVPLNSPEDQCVFWANMNSYAALLKGAQIQRGVGTSTHGDGAFGGTVSLQTRPASFVPTAEANFSYGSYNTMNTGVSFSTGLIGNHLIFDGAYHETRTDGYVHGTSGRSGSYYGGLSYFNNDRTLTLRYKNIGNFEKTGQAWNGVTAGNDDYSMNIYDGVRTYKDLYKLGLGRYNSLYECFKPDWNHNWKISRYTWADNKNWDKTTDNFWQNHNILSLAWEINPHWTTSGALHYTHGYGYYKEFRYQNKTKKFGLDYPFNGTVKKSDFVRKKGLEQDTYGLLWNANYKGNGLDLLGGISLQQFAGNHFGELTYISNEDLRNHYMNDGKPYSYYDSDADKGDYSAYLKGTFTLTKGLEAFADLQYRHVSYKTDGINDKFVEVNPSVTPTHYANQRLDIDKKYDFFNPKAGLSYTLGQHRLYASYALSHREPERNNFTDNGSCPAPKAESVNDFELGYHYNGSNWHAGVQLYYMDYVDQFVQTGAISDIGEKLTTNIKDSYRMGIEISADWSPFHFLTLEGNASLSRNRIKDFTEIVETYNNNWKELAATEIHYNCCPFAYSPDVILNGMADFHYKGFQAIWHTGFVGRQYLDNTGNKDRSLPCFATSNIHLNYDLKCGKTLKDILFGLQLNNIFNRHYAASGWVYSSIVGDLQPNDKRYYQIGYIPMAGFTVMGSVTFRF